MAVKIKIDGDTKGFEQKVAGLDKTAEKAMKGVRIAAAAAGAALVALGGYALSVGKQFEAGMSGVEAVLQGTEKEMEQLASLAKEMGATTVYSATQAAEALQYIAQAGYDATGAAKLLPDVLNLAATDAMDLGVAAQYVTNGLAIFGDAAGGAAHYADVLATTASAADGSVSDMAEAFMVAGGQAMLAGLDLDDLATAVGVLANNGIKGSEGGTHLRNALKNLYTPTTDATKAIEELGIETRNADGTLVGMQDVLAQFQTQLSGLDQAARLDYMGRIFDTRTLAAANALINNATDEWGALAGSIENSAGMAARMAEIKLDNLEGDITLLKSAAEGFGIQLYESFGDSARAAVQSLTRTVENLMRTFAQPAIKAAVADIGKAIGTLIETIGKIVGAVLPAFIQALGLLARNMNVVAPAIITVVAALTALKIINTVMSGTEALTKSFEKNAAAALGMKAAHVRQLGTLIAEKVATLAMNVAILAQAAATKLATAAANGNVLAMVAYNVIMGIATAATWLFNAALSANPIGVVIIAIAALVAAVVGLVAIFNQESEQLKELKSGTEDVIAANNELRNSMEESAAAYQDNLAKAESSAGTNDKLVTSLLRLSNNYDGSSAAASKMRIMVAQLNNSVDGLNLAFNEQTGELNLNEKAMRSLIAAQKESAKADAEAARSMELTQELVKQEESLRNTQAELDEWRKALNSGSIDQGQFNKGTKDLIVEEELLKEAIAATEENIQYYTDAAAEAAIASEEAANAAAYSEENLALLAAAYEVTADEIRAATDGTVASLDAWEAAQQELQASADEMAAAMVERYEELSNQAENALGRIEQATALTAQQLIANIEANTETMNAFAENLAGAREKVASDEYSPISALVEQLAAKGPAYADQLAVIAGMTDAELAALVDAFDGNAEAAAAAMAAEFGLPSTTNAGAEAVDEIAAGVDTNSALITACGTNVEDAIQAMKDAIDTAKLPVMGRTMITSLAAGVQAANSTAVSASASVGANMMAGLETAINNGRSGVIEAMRSAINDAIAAAKAAAQIASPSKRMRDEVGVWMGAGLAEGIDESTKDVVASVDDQIGAALNEYRNADVPDLRAVFMAEFEDIPANFFEMGRSAGEDFVAGFNIGALGFMSMLEAMLMGSPEMAYVPSQQSVRGYRDIVINFNENMDGPDAYARSVRQVFEYGLAGERD